MECNSPISIHPQTRVVSIENLDVQRMISPEYSVNISKYVDVLTVKDQQPGGDRLGAFKFLLKLTTQNFIL